MTLAGLGPMAVLPQYRRKGTGSMLVREEIERYYGTGSILDFICSIRYIPYNC